MYILVKDNSIAGYSDNGSAPDGYMVIEYNEPFNDIRDLYYNMSSASIQRIPPKPGNNYQWSGQQWVVIERPDFKPSPKEQFIGTAIYKWAKSRAATDQKVMLLYITACCADAVNENNELRDAVKELRDLRNVEQNTKPGTNANPVSVTATAGLST